MTKKTEPKGLYVRIPPELHRRLKIEAIRQQRSMQDLVAEFIRDGLRA